MKNATDITIVLDRSGSMADIRSDVIGGFNRFVKDQQAVLGECKLTLIQFDTQDPYEVVRDNVPIGEVRPLDEATYQPRSGTPLYDCLGRAIVNTGERIKNLPESERPDKVIFVIQTDGLNNASHEYTRERVFEMVKLQETSYKWQFVYLGADQDAMAAGGGIGISMGTSMKYEKTAGALRAVYAGASANVASFRTGEKKDLAWTAEQRAEAAKP